MTSAGAAVPPVSSTGTWNATERSLTATASSASLSPKSETVIVCFAQFSALWPEKSST
nr:hypothetical protein [Mycolicibacterium insubricum]